MFRNGDDMFRVIRMLRDWMSSMREGLKVRWLNRMGKFGNLVAWMVEVVLCCEIIWWRMEEIW